ncbi:transglycosylase SLT domain-containing protein [Treponema pectinovorum]|uniref:transglycosylase SLT domain-containing protein n=1 Tax=Treponema pectinovorum TaxID=164 RepID=UPI003D90616C
MAKKCKGAILFACFFCIIPALTQTKNASSNGELSQKKSTQKIESSTFANPDILKDIGGIKIPPSPYAQNSINSYIKKYTTSFARKNLFEILDRAEIYRLYVRQELKKRGMPPAIEYLPVVESEYKPMAVSKSGARGLWQFMDNSLDGFLKKSQYVDERYDPWKSTDAALSKLQENYAEFKDWALAIAAYNCGKGAMKHALKNAKVKSFWYLAEHSLLRDESVQYVPKMLAICALATDGKKYEIQLPEITKSTRYAEFDYITTKEKISLERLASELKMESEILQNLNSALLKGFTPPASIYSLRLPSGMKRSAEIAIEEITGKSNHLPQKAFIMHTVQKGETLWSISKKYGVSVQELKDANKIRDNEVLSIGKILYIKS